MTDLKLTYFGRVTESGEMKLPGAKMRKEAMEFAGKDIEVTVQRKRKKRSDPQNRYYWGVVVEMVRSGIKDMTTDALTPDQVHELLKLKFHRVQKVDEDTGEVLYEYTGSTAAMKTIEFMEYIEKCCQFAAEYLGVVIPLPE
jgi:hypothetical protein